MLLFDDNFITQIKSSCSIIYFLSIFDNIIVNFADTTRNSLSQIEIVRSSLYIITITYKEFVVITQMFKGVLYIIESFINSEIARFFTHKLRRFTYKTCIRMAYSLHCSTNQTDPHDTEAKWRLGVQLPKLQLSYQNEDDVTASQYTPQFCFGKMWSF